VISLFSAWGIGNCSSSSFFCCDKKPENR